MGDRLATTHNRHRPKSGGLLCPLLGGSWVPHLTQYVTWAVGWGRPSSVPAAVWQVHGPKMGVLFPFFWGELGPHLTQCGLGRGLPPYQVAYWSVERLPKITTALSIWCTSVTDHRQTTDRQTDGRQQIANVNVSSRSLKTIELIIKQSTLHTSIRNLVFWRQKLFRKFRWVTLKGSAKYC